MPENCDLMIDYVALFCLRTPVFGVFPMSPFVIRAITR